MKLLKTLIRFSFVLLCLEIIDHLISKPILEYICKTEMTSYSYMWFADVFFLLPIGFYLYWAYDRYIFKYIEKWMKWRQ